MADIQRLASSGAYAAQRHAPFPAGDARRAESIDDQQSFEELLARTRIALDAANDSGAPPSHNIAASDHNTPAAQRWRDFSYSQEPARSAALRSRQRPVMRATAWAASFLSAALVISAASLIHSNDIAARLAELMAWAAPAHDTRAQEPSASLPERPEAPTVAQQASVGANAPWAGPLQDMQESGAGAVAAAVPEPTSAQDEPRDAPSQTQTQAQPPETMAATPAPRQTARADAASATPPSPPPGGLIYAVQIGVAPTAQDAAAMAAAARRTFSDELGRRQLALRPAEREGRSFYRVRFAGLSESDARAICSGLALRSRECLVVKEWK